MTHQQMIDFWQNQIIEFEAEQANGCSDLKRLHELDALIKQAQNIYMQLVTMRFDAAEIKTHTSAVTFKIPQHPPLVILYVVLS